MKHWILVVVLCAVCLAAGCSDKEDQEKADKEIVGILNEFVTEVSPVPTAKPTATPLPTPTQKPIVSPVEIEITEMPETVDEPTVIVEPESLIKDNWSKWMDFLMCYLYQVTADYYTSEDTLDFIEQYVKGGYESTIMEHARSGLELSKEEGYGAFVPGKYVYVRDDDGWVTDTIRYEEFVALYGIPDQKDVIEYEERDFVNCLNGAYRVINPDTIVLNLQGNILGKDVERIVTLKFNIVGQLTDIVEGGVEE